MPAHHIHTPVADMFGTFYGYALDRAECEMKAIQYVDKKNYAFVEAGLFNTKWFDYRFMHPTLATYLFTHYYLEAYRSQIAARMDVGRAQFAQPIKNLRGEIFKADKREYTALWKARQAADELGIPYDFYCYTLMRETGESLWTRIPRPQQMYSPNLKVKVTERWVEESEARIILAKDIYYQAPAYCGAEYQDDYREYLSSLINSRLHPQHLLCSMMERGHIDAAFAKNFNLK